VLFCCQAAPQKDAPGKAQAVTLLPRSAKNERLKKPFG
jgi:hypothetical protein